MYAPPGVDSDDSSEEPNPSPAPGAAPPARPSFSLKALFRPTHPAQEAPAPVPAQIKQSFTAASPDRPSPSGSTKKFVRWVEGDLHGTDGPDPSYRALQAEDKVQGESVGLADDGDDGAVEEAANELDAKPRAMPPPQETGPEDDAAAKEVVALLKQLMDQGIEPDALPPEASPDPRAKKNKWAKLVKLGLGRPRPPTDAVSLTSACTPTSPAPRFSAGRETWARPPPTHEQGTGPQRWPPPFDPNRPWIWHHPELGQPASAPPRTTSFPQDQNLARPLPPSGSGEGPLSGRGPLQPPKSAPWPSPPSQYPPWSPYAGFSQAQHPLPSFPGPGPYQAPPSYPHPAQLQPWHPYYPPQGFPGHTPFAWIPVPVSPQHGSPFSPMSTPWSPHGAREPDARSQTDVEDGMNTLGLDTGVEGGREERSGHTQTSAPPRGKSSNREIISPAGPPGPAKDPSSSGSSQSRTDSGQGINKGVPEAKGGEAMERAKQQAREKARENAKLEAKEKARHGLEKAAVAGQEKMQEKADEKVEGKGKEKEKASEKVNLEARAEMREPPSEQSREQARERKRAMERAAQKAVSSSEEKFLEERERDHDRRLRNEEGMSPPRTKASVAVEDRVGGPSSRSRKVEDTSAMAAAVAGPSSEPQNTSIRPADLRQEPREGKAKHRTADARKGDESQSGDAVTRTKPLGASAPRKADERSIDPSTRHVAGARRQPPTGPVGDQAGAGGQGSWKKCFAALASSIDILFQLHHHLAEQQVDQPNPQAFPLITNVLPRLVTSFFTGGDVVVALAPLFDAQHQSLLRVLIDHFHTIRAFIAAQSAKMTESDSHVVNTGADAPGWHSLLSRTPLGRYLTPTMLELGADLVRRCLSGDLDVKGLISMVMIIKHEVKSVQHAEEKARRQRLAKDHPSHGITAMLDKLLGLLHLTQGGHAPKTTVRPAKDPAPQKEPTKPKIRAAPKSPSPSSTTPTTPPPREIDTPPVPDTGSTVSVYSQSSVCSDGTIESDEEAAEMLARADSGPAPRSPSPSETSVETAPPDDSQVSEAKALLSEKQGDELLVRKAVEEGGDSEITFAPASQRPWGYI